MASSYQVSMFLKKTTVDGYEKCKSDFKKNHLHKNIFARWNVENDVGEHLTANHRQGGL